MLVWYFKVFVLVDDSFHIIMNIEVKHSWEAYVEFTNAKDLGCTITLVSILFIRGWLFDNWIASIKILILLIKYSYF